MSRPHDESPERSDARPPEEPTQEVARRDFLLGAAIGTIGLGATTVAPRAQEARPGGGPADAPGADRPRTAIPTEAERSAEEGPPEVDFNPRIVRDPASDWMVDVLKGLDLEYVATNPGSSFKGLHESLINYGGNAK